MKRFLMAVFVLLAFSLSYGETIVVASDVWDGRVNEDHSGLYIDILEAVYANAGYTFEYQIVPYARSVAMVQNQAADLFVSSYYEEAEGVLYSAKEMFFDADVVVAVYPDNMEFSGQADLAGKTVGWMRGYAYDEYLDVEVKLYEIDNRENGLKMLQHGRLDYFLEAKSDIEAIDKSLLEGLDVTILLQLHLYYAFANNEKGQKLLQIYQERFPVLLESGEIRALYEKWGFDYLW